MKQKNSKDMQIVQRYLRESGLSAWVHSLRNKSLARYLVYITVDWLLIACSIYIFVLEPYLLPASIIIIGNRQRALGNILHDFSHGGFKENHKMIDLLANILLALPAMSTISLYRKAHLGHHVFAGDPEKDPDYINIFDADQSFWRIYLELLISMNFWVSSVFGFTLKNQRCFLFVFTWWAVVLSISAVSFGPYTTISFFALWFVSRATTFHAITILREMADHVGKVGNGIFSYTRNSPTASIWNIVIHPHSNGIHLLHHLLPDVPFYNLKKIHERLLQWSLYAENEHCDQYFRYFFNNQNNGLVLTDSISKRQQI